jgi:hypothetical protein
VVSLKSKISSTAVEIYRYLVSSSPRNKNTSGKTYISPRLGSIVNKFFETELAVAQFSSSTRRAASHETAAASNDAAYSLKSFRISLRAVNAAFMPSSKRVKWGFHRGGRPNQVLNLCLFLCDGFALLGQLLELRGDFGDSGYSSWQETKIDRPADPSS